MMAQKWLRFFLIALLPVAAAGLAGCVDGGEDATSGDTMMNDSTDADGTKMNDQLGDEMGGEMGDGMGDMKPATRFRVDIASTSTGQTLQTSNGPAPVPLSPGVWAVFHESDPFFATGVAASEGTERLAEDGAIDAQAAQARDAMGVASSDKFVQEGGALGSAFEPGSMTSFEIVAHEGARFQFQTMFVQSNDWFYAFPEGGLALFDAEGTPIIGDVTSMVVLFDAGSEVDEEPGAGTTQKPNQDADALDVGPAEGGVVRPVADTPAAMKWTIPPTSSVIRVTLTPLS